MADPFPEPSFDAGTKQDEAPPRPPPRKRRRLVISCTECHRRKQKCDRNLPCANCISRNKQEACRYETGPPSTKEHRKNAGHSSPQSRGDHGDSLPTKVADFGYSQTGASTLGFLKRIDNANPEEPLARLAGDSAQPSDHYGVRERYKSLIRQLPARTYIDKLVSIYFRDFNWQYYPLDEDIFMKQMAEWNNMSFSILTTQGPQGLAPELRAFPALLFQVMATALLVLPGNSDPMFDSLKYAGNMTFEDLALDYSESGVAILSVLGKRQMGLTTVLAGFLRAAFLKYVALVTEAWHAIGSAIRDAQEIGLHKTSLDPKPASDDIETVLENQWHIQQRRRLWMTLIAWDLHTGIVLGRPTTIDRTVEPTLPVDAPIPKDRSKTPVQPREEDDPPTPITRALWSYQIMAVLRDICDLEREGPCPKSFDRVDDIDDELHVLEESTPPWFRLENPDTTFDDHPDCYWLPWVRATMPQLLAFDFMALHRPYIFTRPTSRSRALKSSLAMLHSQRLHFQTLRPEQYKTFSLFFGTFDAIVLMSAIYILFPKENPSLLQNAMQHFQWSVERFETMSERNSLAKAAVSVLRAIYIRLKKSLGMGFVCKSPVPAIETPASLVDPISNIDPSLTDGSLTGSTGPSPTVPSANGYTPGASSLDTSSNGDPYGAVSAVSTTAAEPTGGQGIDFGLPPDFDWASIQPIFPTGDLVYNDLSGIGNSVSASASAWTPNTPSVVDQSPWQFDGDFTNNSLWNVLNQYTPF